ncbi:MAG: hypothetical protein R6X25_00115, partial [Candidatus Krumholzibacteriia bacterium]
MISLVSRWWHRSGNRPSRAAAPVIGLLVVVQVLALSLFAAPAPAAETPGPHPHPLGGSAADRATALERVQPRLQRLHDDGWSALQHLRLAGEKAPASLEAVLVTCDFADSLLVGRHGQVPGDFPAPAQSAFYYAAHDSVYFHHLMADVAAYFGDVSGGRFALNFTVHPRTVNLPEAMGFYGDHAVEGEQHVLLAAAVVDSLDGEIDFSRYDTVILVHAGAGEETDILGNSPEQIFSTYLGPDDFAAAAADSVIEQPYLATDDFPAGRGIEHVMVLPETEFQDGVLYGSLGVYCFEVGLRLGMLSLSDFTPPGAPDSQGIGQFGLMGYGLFVAGGYIPAHPIAFNKLLMGWLEPQIADPDAEPLVTVRPAEQAGGEDPTVRVEINGREYWLAEYRLQDPDGNHDFDFPGDLNGNGIPDYWDADSVFGDGTPSGFFDPATDIHESLVGAEWDFFMSENVARDPHDITERGSGSGLYIWHVDEGVIADVFSSRRNLFNADPRRKSVDLEEADGIQDLDSRNPSPYMFGGDDDSFRGEGQDRFGPYTRPDTRSAGGAWTGILFEDISPVVLDSTHAYPDGRVGILYADSLTFRLRRLPAAAAAPVMVARRELPAGADLAGSHLLAVDLDGDGSSEIVAAGHVGEVWAFGSDLSEHVDRDGDPATTEPLAVGRDGAGRPVVWNLPAAAGDLDGDGALEIVLTGPDGLYGFDAAGDEIADGDLDPASFGRLVALEDCRVPAVLIPRLLGADPGAPAAAVVVESRAGASVLRFLTAA